MIEFLLSLPRPCLPVLPCPLLYCPLSLLLPCRGVSMIHIVSDNCILTDVRARGSCRGGPTAQGARRQGGPCGPTWAHGGPGGPTQAKHWPWPWPCSASLISVDYVFFLLGFLDEIVDDERDKLIASQVANGIYNKTKGNKKISFYFFFLFLDL